MRDIQVLFIRDGVPIRSADLVSLEPTVIRLQGRDFIGAVAVQYGRHEITDIALIDRQTLDIRLTDEIANSPPPSTISVISETFTATPHSRVVLHVNRARTTSGALRLLQQFILVLFTTPKSRLLNLSEGGNLQKIIAEPRSADDRGHLVSLIASAIHKTAQQIQDNYVLRPVPLNERLAAARMVSAVWDEESRLRVLIEVENAAGAAAAANVGIQ